MSPCQIEGSRAPRRTVVWRRSSTWGPSVLARNVDHVVPASLRREYANELTAAAAYRQGVVFPAFTFRLINMAAVAHCLMRFEIDYSASLASANKTRKAGASF